MPAVPKTEDKIIALPSRPDVHLKLAAECLKKSRVPRDTAPHKVFPPPLSPEKLKLRNEDRNYDDIPLSAKTVKFTAQSVGV